MDIASWTAIIPADLQAHIRRMVQDNPLWGEERIADELLLTLGLRVGASPILDGLHHEYCLEKKAA